MNGIQEVVGSIPIGSTNLDQNPRPGQCIGPSHWARDHDSDAVRQDLRDRGAAPEIPTKRSRKVQYSVDGSLYALRARIECFFSKLKDNRRIATRYDQTSTSFLSPPPRAERKYCGGQPQIIML